MKSKQAVSGDDYITPAVDLIREIFVMLVKLIWDVGVFTYNKVTNAEPEIKQINRKCLKVKKYTDSVDALGVDTASKKEMKLENINFKKHSFIVGASGFGKTNLISILQEHDLENDRPIIFFDPKGDLEALTTFKKLVESKGRSCYIFSEHYEDSISLNPVLEGTANQVADRIMRAFEWSEQYYKDVANRTLLQALKDLEKEDIHFSLKNIYDVISARYESKDTVGLLVKLEKIIESDFGKVLNGGNDGLTLSKIREQRACLYIGLSTQGYGETAMAVGKLFLEELLYNSYSTLTKFSDSHQAQKNPISVYFDEFGSLVTNQFIELQNKCRGAGIQLTMAVQSASDIAKIDEQLAQQIIENASNLFVMKQRLDDSSSLYSNAIGTFLTNKDTIATEDGEDSGKGTQREVHELLVHPDIIKNLKVGQCVLLQQDPVRINLINIRNRREKEVIKKEDCLNQSKTIEL